MSPFYDANQSVNAVLSMFSMEEKKRQNKTSESVKWQKSTKFEDFDNISVIQIRQMNVNIETAMREASRKNKHTRTADECDKFCTQKLICTGLHKIISQ